MKRIVQWLQEFIGMRHWHAHQGMMRRRVDDGWETRPMTQDEAAEDDEWWQSIR